MGIDIDKYQVLVVRAKSSMRNWVRPAPIAIVSADHRSVSGTIIKVNELARKSYQRSLQATQLNHTYLHPAPLDLG